MSGTWLWKDPEGQEDLDRMIQHAVPGWAADRFAHSAGPTYYEFGIDKIDFWEFCDTKY